jgi:DNA primase
MTAIDEIKSRIDIVELVSETVKLRRAGKSYTGFCPFHPNSRTPAFVVFPDSGTWRCFGQCNEGGDVFRFVMKKEGWDFPQTLQYLAQKAGVVLESQTPERQAEDEEHARLRGLLEEAVLFYHHHLQTPAGGEALAYLKQRGLTPDTIDLFGLGYAPNAWESALAYFTKKGYTPDELLQSGLVTERTADHAEGRGGVYDRFRNRIMFPIRDTMGHMAGFGARILNPEDMPKFLNSPQTALFDKGRLLYGLDLARKALRAQDQAVIVEGYLDVILLHQAGFSNTVSPMGTALTEDQFRLLKRFTRKMVIALDADAAGEKATLRGLDVARQAMDHADELVFDARGLLRHEARLQADLRVTTLPPGMDPDEVVLRNPEEWKHILEAAQPVVIHVMDTLAKAHDLNDPKAKSTVAAEVLPLIEDVPNAVERDAYRQRLARLLRVDESALAIAQRRPPRITRRGPVKEGARPAPVIRPDINPARHGLELEAHILRLLLRQPEVLNPLDRSLLENQLSRLGAQDFESTDHQLLARRVQDALEQDELEPHQFILRDLPDALADLSQSLLAPMALGEPTSDQLQEDLFKTVLMLRQVRISENIGQLRYLQEELQEQGDLSRGPYHEMMLQYAQTLARLNRALAGPVRTE